MKKKNCLKKVLTAILALVLTATCIPAIPAKAANLSEVLANLPRGASAHIVASSPNGVWVHSTMQLSTANHLFLLGYGNSLEIISTTDDDWIKVETNMSSTGYGYVVNDPDLIDIRTDVVDGNMTKVRNMEARVTASNLNVHSVAGLGYRCIGVLSKGACVPVVAYNDSWVEIKLLSKVNNSGYNHFIQGFVSRDYVRLIDSTNNNQNPDAPYEEPATTNFKDLNNRNIVALTSTLPVNIHMSPSINSTVVYTLKNGYMVKGVAQSSDWYEVMWRGANGKYKTGYVIKQYSTNVNATGAPRISKRNFTMNKGASRRIYLCGIISQTDKAVPVKWSSSRKNVATISANGQIKAKVKGSTTITCKFNNGYGWVTLKTTVKVK